MSTHERTTRGYHLVRSAVAAGLLIASTLLLQGQAQIDTGRALDRSLELGSGGYNSRSARGARFRQPRYRVGASKSLYVTGRGGQMRYSKHNAFNPSRGYRATGYQGNYTSRSSHRRFRY